MKCSSSASCNCSLSPCLFLSFLPSLTNPLSTGENLLHKQNLCLGSSAIWSQQARNHSAPQCTYSEATVYHVVGFDAISLISETAKVHLILVCINHANLQGTAMTEKFISSAVHNSTHAKSSVQAHKDDLPSTIHRWWQFRTNSAELQSTAVWEEYSGPSQWFGNNVSSMTMYRLCIRH